MYIVSTFEYSIYLELAIRELEQKGIEKQKILAIPLDIKQKSTNVFDSIHHSDGRSLIDGAFILGTALMVIGAIYGFVLKWGPIICGLIGLGIGSIIGFLLDYGIGKIRGIKYKSESNRKSEVVIIVNCLYEESALVEKVLNDNNAVGIGRLSFDNR